MFDTALTHYCQRNPSKGAVIAFLVVIAACAAGGLIDNKHLWSNL